MDIEEALSIVSRQTPCRHDTHNKVNDTYLKCEDCGLVVNVKNLPRYQKSADQFDAAIRYLRSLEKENA